MTVKVLTIVPALTGVIKKKIKYCGRALHPLYQRIQLPLHCISASFFDRLKMLFWNVFALFLVKSPLIHLVDAEASVEARASRPGQMAMPSLVGSRIPSLFYANDILRRKENFLQDGLGCDTGAICVGPLHDFYPIGHEPGVFFTSRFEVPELPRAHDREKTTYYGKQN